MKKSKSKLTDFSRLRTDSEEGTIGDWKCMECKGVFEFRRTGAFEHNPHGRKPSFCPLCGRKKRPQ